MLKSVEKLSGENIIVVTYAAPFDPTADIGAAQQQIVEIIKRHPGQFVRIDDLSRAEMTWSQFILGIQTATVQVAGSMTDPHIHGVLVGDYEMVQIASESMQQDQYGATQTPVFGALDEALDYARHVPAT